MRQSARRSEAAWPASGCRWPYRRSTPECRQTILGPTASNGPAAALAHNLGPDRPLPVRYGEWIGDFVKGDWGRSVVFGMPVHWLVLGRLKDSLLLAGFALLILVPLPIGSSNVPSANPIDIVRQFMLPALSLALVLFGYIMRMARAGTVDALAANYTRTAILKGIPRRRVIRKHVLRNSLLPTIGVISVSDRIHDRGCSSRARPMSPARGGLVADNFTLASCGTPGVRRPWPAQA